MWEKQNTFFLAKKGKQFLMGKFSWTIKKCNVLAKGKKRKLIGEDLTFDEHVSRVRGKLVSAAFMLNQSKSFLPLKSRLQVYRSKFESHLNFASIVWSVSKNTISRLNSVQQKGQYSSSRGEAMFHKTCPSLTSSG